MYALRRFLWGLHILRIITFSTISSVVAQFRLRISGAAKIGHGLVVTGWLYTIIHPNAEVQIGDEVRLNSGFERNVVGGYRRMTLDIGSGASLIIGGQTAISNSTIVCRQLVSIGDHVFIGGGCNIYDTDFHPLEAERRQDRHQLPRTAPIILGNHCFIGGHTTILKGVTIGEGAVVGAGSVVTKDIPAFEVWAGNPVHFIRKLENNV
ncbi:MAG: acyltransferase [Anaerolineales bacterium]